MEKKKTEEPKVLLGRPGNTLKMGIVGLPNVGKSTTFNLLSKQSVPAENFMFCTINPNLARVEVPDARFNFLNNLYKPKSSVPATLNILDIAGLVRGASQGQGMGNAFLSHIQSVDGIYHVIRAFDDEEIQHYDGEVDPVRDLETIKLELVEKDKQLCEKRLEEATAKAKRNGLDKQAALEKEILEKVKALLDEGKNVRDRTDWTYKEIDFLNSILFFTAKPGVYLVNLSEEDYFRKKNKYLAKILKWINENGGGKLIPYSAAFELKLFEASPEEREKLLKDNNTESALPKIILNGYHSLDLIHFFTAGTDEVKCWTIRRTTKAPQAAGVIHTDFERGFISADVTKYDDLEKLGSEQEVKKEGKVRCEGKNYEVLDGDIIFFKFNVSDPKKKK
jgi:obg-like ATPase 1